MKRIQIWGDSILKGVIFDENKQKYVILKHTALSDAAEQLSCEICNFSRFGQTVLHAQPKLEAHLNDKIRPDIIVLEMGGNDCDFNWKEVGDAPKDEHLPNTSLSLYAKMITAFVDKIKSKGIVPILATLPPLDPQRYFNWITKGNVSREGVLQWLGTEFRIYTWHEQYDLCLRKIAAEKQIRIADIRSTFLKQRDYRDYLCIDGIHPNERGQKLIAETLKPFLSFS